jgi:hypothetical protein
MKIAENRVLKKRIRNFSSGLRNIVPLQIVALVSGAGGGGTSCPQAGKP